MRIQRKQPRWLDRSLRCAGVSIGIASGFSTVVHGAQALDSEAVRHEELAESYHWERKFVQAEAEYKAAAQLDARLKWTILPLWDEEGKWEAILAATKGVRISGCPTYILGPMACAYHAQGNAALVRAILTELQGRLPERPSDDFRSYVIAYIELWEGDRAECLRWLGKITGDRVLQYAQFDPKFAILQGDPRFLEIVRSRVKSR